MTGGTGAGGGQLDLFGSTVPAPRHPDQPTPAASSPAETNDVDLIRHIAGNAARGLYLLVSTSERVYARADGPDSVAVVRVPRYEEAAVHQLIRRRWLTHGNGTHRVTCGAAQLVGTAVLCPRSTRALVERWEHLARPANWAEITAANPRGRHLRSCP